MSANTIRNALTNGAIPGGVGVDRVALTEVNGLSGYDGTAPPLLSSDPDAAGSYPLQGIQGAEKFLVLSCPARTQIVGTAAIGFPTHGTQHVAATNNAVARIADDVLQEAGRGRIRE